MCIVRQNVLLFECIVYVYRKFCKTFDFSVYAIKKKTVNSLVQSKSCFKGPIKGFVLELKEMYKNTFFCTEITHLIVPLNLYSIQCKLRTGINKFIQATRAHPGAWSQATDA